MKNHNPKGPRAPYLAASFAALLVAILVLHRMLSPVPEGAPRRPATLYTAVNTSVSSSRELPPSKGFIAGAAMALPPRSRLVLDRFDRLTENVFEGPVPADEDELLATIGPRLTVRRDLDDTLTDRLVARAEEVVATAPGPTAIAVVGDGYAEGVTPEGHAAIRATASRMAADPKLVGFYVVGAEPAARAEIRRDLAPLGNRLRFMELSDDPATIADALEAAS